MRYIYECPKCFEEYEIVKPVDRLDEVERCSKCQSSLNRIITAVQLSPKIKPFEPHFNYGLGRRVSSQRDIDEHLRKIKGDTGREIVEVGTDTLESVKKTRKKYTID